MTAAGPILTGINRFPVKSLRGQAVASAVVEPWGLRGDRRWMVVDSDAVLVTAREHPHMLLARPQITGRGLRITRPGADPIEIDTPDGSRMCDVAVWKSVVSAAVATSEANDWFTDLLGQPVRLVYLDDPTRRRPNPLYAKPDDRVSFADGYPLLVTSEASLAALNQHIADGPRSVEGPLPMIRFRPNLVVGGTTAWAEDLPRGQGLRSLRADHDRPRDGGQGQGADRHARPASPLGRQDLVRHESDPGHPWRQPRRRRRARDSRGGRRHGRATSLA
jgi:uncharacterized protein